MSKPGRYHIDTDCGGYWDISCNCNPLLPGLNIEFISYGKPSEKVHPKIAVEFPSDNEGCTPKMRAFVWTSPEEKDCPEEITFNNCTKYFNRKDYITQNRLDTLNAALKWKEGDDLEYRMDEDDMWTRREEFQDGSMMRIEVYGVPYTEGGDNSAKARAVLIKDGKEVAGTEPGHEIIGDWTIEYNGDTYVTELGAFFLDEFGRTGWRFDG